MDWKLVLMPLSFITYDMDDFYRTLLVMWLHLCDEQFHEYQKMNGKYQKKWSEVGAYLTPRLPEYTLPLIVR